ncbi:hypothetical protein SKAU_G00014450 [Synaphobranchus kaupii]|uniref:Uncharacterized protein n=1 Tax=Synaphobranchus kaupii TaxID=118154 RepID=A0A9Q1JDN7_SYNKA|nr:hypothetical protein SKAU_G00014450 [Synaphobranchus kaupii]
MPSLSTDLYESGVPRLEIPHSTQPRPRDLDNTTHTLTGEENKPIALYTNWTSLLHSHYRTPPRAEARWRGTGRRHTEDAAPSPCSRWRLRGIKSHLLPSARTGSGEDSDLIYGARPADGFTRY